MPGARPAVPRVSFDNRGIGETREPAGAVHGRGSWPRTRCRCSTRPGVERAHVLGASLGGMVAQALARSPPRSASTRLVLACTSPGGPDAYPLPEATLRLLAEAPSLAPEVALRRFVENALAPEHAGRSSSTRSSPTGRRTRPTRPAGRRRRAARAAFARRPPGRDRRADARPHRHRRRRRRPAQRGAARRADPGRAARAASTGAGHLFFWEQPDEFVAARDGVPRMTALAHVDRWLRDRARIDARRASRSTPPGARGRTPSSIARSDELAARRSRAGDRVVDADRQHAPSTSPSSSRCAKAGAILHPISWRLAPAEVALPARRRRARGLPGRGRVPASSPRRRSSSRGLRRRSSCRRDRRGVRARRDDDPLLLDLHLAARPASRRARCSRTRTASGRTSRSTSRRARRRRRRAAGAAAVPLRRLERAAAARVVEGRARRARARLRRRRVRSS